jgi:hypothetical protein
MASLECLARHKNKNDKVVDLLQLTKSFLYFSLMSVEDVCSYSTIVIVDVIVVITFIVIAFTIFPSTYKLARVIDYHCIVCQNRGK